MGTDGTNARHGEIAANGGGVAAQVERVEDELREIHGRLDGVLCAIETLLRSPALDPHLASIMYDAIEPASEAILHGASRLRDHVPWSRKASGA